jgi:hypothetical protein
MAASAKTPTRISFIRAIRVIRRQVDDQAAISPSELEHGINDTHTEMQQRLLPNRRHRSCPRVVKRRTAGQKETKKKHHAIINRDGPATIHVFNQPAAQVNGIGLWPGEVRRRSPGR